MYDDIDIIKTDLSKYWKIVFDYNVKINNKNQVYELVNDIYSFDLNTLQNNNFSINKKIALINSNKNKNIWIIFLDKNQSDLNDRELKESLRDKYTIWVNIDIADKKYYTFHSWDWKDENLYLKNILLNKNITNYNFRQNILQDSKIISYLDHLNKYCKENNINKNDICIVGSAIMHLYGLKKLNDLDIIIGDDLLEIDDSGHLLHKNTQYSTIYTNNDLISNHFIIFRSFKIINLDTLYQIKCKKNRKKDIHDIESINNFLQSNKVKKDYFLILKFKIQYYKKIFIVYFFMIATKLTKSLGVYNFCSYIWRKYFLKQDI